ncbi:hypothetical protein D3Z39_16420 [Anaerotruncus colihominis]|jgi:hypothetical protein|uniref:Uncharacterized protein n=1 Tax=Anaerotruncus colihominis TaxID=169435 RepID=A0A845RLB0_9FIRM|nr:hypothetical protein [Anaerotruncus colihominis]
MGNQSAADKQPLAATDQQSRISAAAVQTAAALALPRPFPSPQFLPRRRNTVGIFYRLRSAIYKKLAIRAVPGAGPLD